ncbi:MAG: phosphotransferase [Moorea sp. SIOASIH]|uniref:phosphotransferase n=1 Tax=Moorena sp. SIOASIH TaxID=2607817 RepID=UPI0013B80A9F|nr:phosphotransferase [Moorena sp. SIOASIH]NEO42216.1 phosphotransferase [Moorena sp. SIOASIH]
MNQLQQSEIICETLTLAESGVQPFGFYNSDRIVVEQVFSNLPSLKKVAISRVEKLTEGKNNQNFKVYTDSGVFVIKICHRSEVQGINRQVEYSILKKVYRADLGVKPIAFDPKNNSIITEFIDVPVWTFKEIRTAAALNSFGESIRKIHELSPISHTYHIKDLLDRYWHSLKKSNDTIKNFKVFFETIRNKLDAYHQSSDIKFCHNDLYYGNLLKGQKNTIFMDWEMAGMNDIYSDLAAFIHFHHLDNQQTELFLQAYSKISLNRDKLAIHQDAILLRELLWVLTKLQEGHTDHFYADYRQRCLKAVMNKQAKLL